MLPWEGRVRIVCRRSCIAGKRGLAHASRLAPVRTGALRTSRPHSSASPLFMSFFVDYTSGVFSCDDFASMLRTMESYLFSRAVCDMDTISLRKFFLSVIARLGAVRDDGGNIREAYEVILLGEEWTARRMPATTCSSGRSGRATAMRSSGAFTCSPRLRAAGT